MTTTTANNIEFGKYIIEILTEGMYTDSRFIYREYIQNAADQIDEAIKSGLISQDEAFIDVEIDSNKRSISIYDNATGISQNRVYKLLGDVANSVKDRTKNKGFRGIGRLGGLAYCEKLIFETSYNGENVKTTMTWNAKELQKKLKDSNNIMDAVSVMQSIISTQTEPIETDKHFFKVTLENINTSNNLLLDVNNIREYLALVAPVPFYKLQFPICSKIYDYKNNNKLNFDEYVIYINSDKLCKIYQTGIFESNIINGNKKRFDEIVDVEFKEIFNRHDELLAWTWVGIRDSFESQIPDKNNPTRGIRLRKQNIQIGDESPLDKLHKENRGNYYFIGEVHAVHNELIPNSRRDYFNENQNLIELEEALREYFSELYRIYRLSSDTRSKFRKITALDEVKQKFVAKKKSGFTDKQEEIELKKEIETKKIEAQKAVQDLEKIKQKAEQNETLKKVFTGISKKYQPNNTNTISIETFVDVEIEDISDKKNNFRVNNLSNLSRSDRKLISNIYRIIRQVLSPDVAEELITRIEEEYK